MTIERGSLVLLEYVAKLADGTVIEGAQRDGDSSSEAITDLKLVSVGDSSYPVMRGLDQALASAEVNVPQTVTVQPADAYGERRRDKVKMLPIRKLGDETPAVGEEVTVGSEKGVVLSMGSGRVRMDFNHKFAGKTITFDFTVLKHLESDADKILALLTNADMLAGYDLSRMYSEMEDGEDDSDDLDDGDLDAELDDDLDDDGLEAELDEDLGLDDGKESDLDAELDGDLGTDDESKDADLETALDDSDLDAGLDKDLGLDDGKESDLDAELDGDLGTDDESKDADLETALDDSDLDAELDKDLGLDDESKDAVDKDLEDILGLDNDDLDDKDLDDDDLGLDDLDDKDLDDLDDDLDDDDLDDLDDDLDDDDLDDLDDDLDDDDLDDLDDDFEEIEDPYANIQGYMLANNVLTVAIPTSMYRSPDIQNKKFVLQTEIFNFVPNLKEVRFLETHRNVR